MSEAEDNAKKIALRQTNAQAFLLGAMKELVKTYKELPYKDIISYQGSPAHLVSALSNPSEIGTFIGATSNSLSLLSPKLQFFWVKSDGKNKKQEVKEFVFSDHVLGDKMLDLSNLKQDQLTLKERGTIGTDVGVSEFTWSYDNKHSGDKTLKASVTIKFGSIRELLNEQYLNFIFTQNTIEEKVKATQGTSKDNDKEEVAKMIDHRYKMMQAPVTSPTYIQKVAAGESQFTQVKVIVGWSKPDRVASGDFGETFLDAVSATQKTILLYFTKYDLNFGAEGQVTLKIEYIGSLDGMISDNKKADALRIAITKKQEGSFQKLAGLKDIKTGTYYLPRHPVFEDGWWWGTGYNAKNPYDKDAYGYRTDTGTPNASPATLGGKVVQGVLAHELHKALDPPLLDPVTERPGFLFSLAACDYEENTLRMHLEFFKQHFSGASAPKRVASYITRLEKGLEALGAVRANLIRRSSTTANSLFMMSLLQGGKLRYLSVDVSTLNSKDSAVAANAGISVNLKKTTTQAAQGNRAKAISEQFAKVLKHQRNLEIGLAEDKDAPVVDPANAPTSTSKKNSGQRHLYFIRFGDIVDLALSTNEIFESLNARVLLGSISLSSLGIPSVDPKEDSVSIADIPISIDWFSQWFLDNFSAISPPVTSVSIREFLNKLLEDLLAPIMNQSFNSDVARSSSVSFSMCTISFPDGNRDVEIVHGDKANSATTLLKRGQNIDITDIEKVTKAATAWEAQKNLPSVSYFTIFALTKDPKALHGDMEEDKAKGIYHLYIGSDRGIVKSFSFKEKKIPHLRAMHVENNSPGSALILPQDVELVMVGNTFFRNGSIVYVNADFALGSDVATKLGVGGYYLVVKSDNVIDTSKFETRLTCMYLQKPIPRS
jgi:hypothetical protein